MSYLYAFSLSSHTSYGKYKIAPNLGATRTASSCVYSILCTRNNKIYIGRTTNPHTRFLDHKSALFTGKHKNKHLQCDFNKYGIEAFEFKILFHIKTCGGAHHECALINKYKALGTSYNINHVWGKKPSRLIESH